MEGKVLSSKDLLEACGAEATILREGQQSALEGDRGGTRGLRCLGEVAQLVHMPVEGEGHGSGSNSPK